MFSNIKVNFIIHKNADEDILKSIVQLKNQHWHYPIGEHINWIQRNINPDDYHLLLHNDEKLVAYLNMVHRDVAAGKQIHRMLGIGNVCVHKEYQKSHVGILLLNICDFFIRNLKTQGILLTKNHLIPFYEKTNWLRFQGKIFCGDKMLNDAAFLNNTSLLAETEIVFERIF